MNLATDALARQRLLQIERARHAVMDEGGSLTDALVGAWYAQAQADHAWITRSWQRCLAQGQRPGQRVAFDVVPAAAMRRAHEANHALVQAARPVIEHLCRAIASTRYFAILTDAQGTVIDVGGPVDRSDPRAEAIARVGVDLSERSIGTSAIATALAERQPVWLHRGEHFFDDTAAYSCAGAPLFGPDGHCVGMLDLTGIETVERPELKHLVAQSASSIENALLLARPHRLLLQLNWPGRLGPLGGASADGLVCLDADGLVAGANQAARQMIPALAPGQAATGVPLHCDELFAAPHQMLFDAARQHGAEAPPLDLPLWSGLRLHARPVPAGAAPARAAGSRAALGHAPLKDVEIALIRQAVADARGNVMEAARTLGISRATVYRKLGRKP
ncbi:MAG: helix-turn-helix domain-containing protein [Comamonas sp.]